MDCAICKAKQQRIEDLEERLKALTQALEAGIAPPPPEWGLGRQEMVFARCLARGPANRDQMNAALEAYYPTSSGRAANHVSVVMRRLRIKLGEFGWVIPKANTWPALYRIHPDQLEDYRSAMRGEGSHIYTPTGSGRRAA